MLTVGVEEEFLLLDPEGAVRPVAADVVGALDDSRVKPELMTFQVETNSGVWTDLADLDRELRDLRSRVAGACRDLGVRLVAAGAPLMDDPGVELVTDAPRYRGLAAQHPEATAAAGTCACQVHVGLPDRDLAVQVLARLRTWLPTIFALGTNSPVAAGRDTGWQSTRYARQLLWPTFAPPEPWADAAAYDAAVAALVASGTAYDERSVYYLARLSPRYPTIEIRIADTCLAVDDAVLLAGVCRALVTVLVADVEQGRPAVKVSGTALRTALLAVAVDGRPPSSGPDEVTRAVVAARLLRTILPGTPDCDDADVLLCGLERLHREGTGADRQRRLLATHREPRAFVDVLASATAGEETT